MSRRLLVLAWMMPPLIFPRSLQISRTLRVLSERGWKSTVIAVPSAVEPLAPQDARLEKFYRGSYEIRYVEPREEVEPSPFWVRFARRIMRRHYTRELNWIRRAASTLCQQIAIEKPEALISFAQPWINHLVALRVKKRHPGLPWIAHFSDPWVDSPYFNPVDEKAQANAVKQEKSIIAKADAVIFTTQETADLVMAKYPVAWLKKVNVLPHGYDADLLSLMQQRQKSEKFTIAHTGNFYGKREPIALLHALSVFCKENASEKLQVLFVGQVSQTVQEMVQKMNLGHVVKLIPSVPFFESLAMAESADLLLVIDAPSENSVFLPSKVVDYLSLRRPVLALTPLMGASARVLGGLGFPTVDPTDESGILDALRMALTRWKDGREATPLPAEEALRAFDIREVTNGFEFVIKNVIKKQERSNG